MTYQPEPRIEELGTDFYDVVSAAKFPQQILRFRNQAWAERVGLSQLNEAEWAVHFASFQPLPHNLKQPLALRYHGHQFQSYNPRLGDGRGFLFAQFRDPKDHRLLDLGTKGSGQTPWSRGGDGKLTLKGAMREVLATEMLEALNVDTSKSWSVFETGESLFRNDEPSPTRSAVLVRLSHGHIRFGSFQRHAALGDEGNVKKLLDYCCRYYYPEMQNLSDSEKPGAFLRAVTAKTAALCASWMTAGFVHGVLNTDNMNITGESFDYGPYRFLPTYDLHFTAAYFDDTGLYAYGRQPEAVIWNLEQLGSCLTLVSAVEPLQDALTAFVPAFNARICAGVNERLGLKSRGEERDTELLAEVFQFLAASQVGYDQFFFDWYGGRESTARASLSPSADKYFAHPSFVSLLKSLEPGVEAKVRLQNPYFSAIKPTTLLIDEIEAIWAAIEQSDDWSLFNAKVDAIRAMKRVYGRLPI